MIESSSPLVGRPKLRMPAAWRTFKLSEVLHVGSSPLSPWIAFLFAVFITVSAVDDVRLFAQSEQSVQNPWLELACTVAYWGVWMALAFRPQLAAALFIIQLSTMLPLTVMGGPLLLAFGAIAVAAYRVSLRALAVMVGGFLVWQIIWVPFVSDLGSTQLWAYIPVTLLMTSPGLGIKFLREKAIQAEQAQKAADEQAARAAQEQRTELARELHDVVTHGLTMIAVQANLGRLSTADAAKQQALTEIGSMARNSLDDLRRLLQTIRTDEAAAEGTHAQPAAVRPSVACIDLALSITEAQSRLNSLGCPTRVKILGDLEEIPNGLRSTVVRILQEGATNALKHSGKGTECEIFTDVQDDRLELVIRNRMTTGKPRLPVSGTGLAGLRERASRLGGSLEAGPDGGWWRMRTVLPFKERQTVR